MKKLLLFAFALLSVSTFAQIDLSTTLITPVQGQYIPAGSTWNVEVTVTNNGTTPIAITDTLALFPSIGGSYPINGFVKFAAIAPGASVNLSFVHPPLNGPDGNVDFCVETYAWHKTDADSTNNKGCNNILWDSDATVGVDEFSVVELENNSFYSNGVYNVVVNNVNNHTNTKLTVINLAGQTLVSEALTLNNSTIEGAVNVGELKAGVYLFNISSKEGMNLTQKVMVQ